MLSQWQVYTALGIAFLILTPLYAIYLRKRLFFPAWANLSGDSSLDVGTSLAELFYSELQSIRRIHEQAANDVSIWNDKSNVPTLEQSSDGYPWFIREAELIASGTPLLRLVKFLPLLGRPSQVKASIHRFDDIMYLQLRLEGPVVRRLAPGANHVFTRQHPAQELKTLPEAVKLLAYEVFMDLTGITEFSRPEGFRQFTQALHQHTLYQRFETKELAEAALERYAACAGDEERSAAVSYNVGLLLYGKYTALDNRRAIQYFEHALSTPNEALKARAYAGLADAYSQNYQRWKSDDRDDLRRARRCARFAWELGARNRAANPAAIAKAYAYTNFALSTVESEPESERSAREQEAESYYRKAIDHDHRFAVAYNNLGFLYLQRAKMIAQSPVARGGLKGAALGSTGSDLAALRRDLREARHNFEKAVEADSQYPHAYDNLGNVCLAEIDLCDQPHQEALRLDEAERWFHYAVGLDPTYAAAYQDIALLDLRRAWGSDCRSDASLFNVRDGFAFHVKALSALHAEVRPRFCSDMQSNLSRLPLSAGEILSSVHEALREELQNVGCECVRQLSRQELEAV